MRRRTDTVVPLALTAAISLFLVGAACLKKEGAGEEPPPKPSYLIEEAPYGTHGPTTGPFSPQFETSFTVPECRQVRVDLYGTDGKVVATVMDSVVCRGGWRLVPKVMWRTEETEESGLDTVLVPPESLDDGIYFFSVRIGAEERKYKTVLIH